MFKFIYVGILNFILLVVVSVAYLLLIAQSSLSPMFSQTFWLVFAPIAFVGAAALFVSRSALMTVVIATAAGTFFVYLSLFVKGSFTGEGQNGAVYLWAGGSVVSFLCGGASAVWAKLFRTR